MVPGAALTVDVAAETAPGVPVAVNASGLPVSPVDAALSVFAPAVVPSVQLVSAAMPLALVAIVAGDAGVIVPPPPVTVNVTFTPLTGLLKASRTNTDGSVGRIVPTVATCPLPA